MRSRMWLWLLGCLLTCGVASGQVTINEIRIDQPGGDDDEYFELFGPPATSLTGMWYVTLGDGAGGSGTVESVTDLTGATIPASGFFVAGESTMTLATPDLITTLNFENSDNQTHFLVTGFTGLAGDDLDTNDDGVLDVTPWATEIDRIALVEEANPPVNTEYHYGPPQVGPDGNFVPGHSYRCPDGTGPWFIGEFDPLDPMATDTVGDTNGACMGLCQSPQMSAPIVDCVGGTVTLNWAASTAWTTIDVLRDGSTLMSLAGTATTFTDSTPVAGTSYAYEVRGNCATGTGSDFANVDYCQCPPILNFDASSDCVGGAVTLTWGGNAYDSFEIFRDTVSIAVLPLGTESSYIDTTVLPGSTYDYEIVANCGALGTSADSLTHDHCPCPDITLIGCVSDCGANTVTLSWDNGGATFPGGIDIVRDGTTVTTLTMAATGIETYVDTPPAGGAYNYQIVGNCGPDASMVNCSVLHCVAPPAIEINELRIDAPGTNDEEYFELTGAPGTSLSGLTYLVIGDGSGCSGCGSGVIEYAQDLGGFSIGASGFFLAVEAVLDGTGPNGILATEDAIFPINFENGDDVTHMIVAGFTGATGMDIDTVDDGVIDFAPWSAIVDSVGVEAPFDSGLLYGLDTSPICAPAFCNLDSPDMIAKCPGALNVPSDWRAWGMPGLVDTPGAPNACPDCFEILDLNCSTDCVTGDTVLSWTNGSDYTGGITILRDGFPQATLPSNATTYTDPAPGAGIYNYEVQGDCAVGSVNAACLNFLQSGAYTGQENVVFRGEGDAGFVNSTSAVADSLSQLAQNAITIGSLADFSCIDQLGCGDVLWVMLGSFPNRYILSTAEGQMLADAVAAGASVYIEGGSTHAWNPATPFDDFNGLDDLAMLAPGMQGADDSLTQLDGQLFDTLDFTASVDVPYFQDNQVDEDFNDTLIAGTANEIPDGQAGVIWRNSPDGVPDPLITEVDYGVAVYFKTDGANGDTYGDVITSSFELGGYNNGDLASIETLVGAYAAALRSQTCGPVGIEFQRGDCNDDGAKNIADPVRLLNFLFPQAPNTLNCDSACDANDDGSNNIADAVAMLNVLFPTGPPIPWNAPDACGVDPTPDTLTCVGYTNCP